jgi:hypothetical protein
MIVFHINPSQDISWRFLPVETNFKNSKKLQSDSNQLLIYESLNSVAKNIGPLQAFVAIGPKDKRCNPN